MECFGLTMAYAFDYNFQQYGFQMLPDEQRTR